MNVQHELIIHKINSSFDNQQKKDIKSIILRILKFFKI